MAQNTAPTSAHLSSALGKECRNSTVALQFLNLCDFSTPWTQHDSLHHNGNDHSKSMFHVGSSPVPIKHTNNKSHKAILALSFSIGLDMALCSVAFGVQKALESCPLVVFRGSHDEESAAHVQSTQTPQTSQPRRDSAPKRSVRSHQSGPPLEIRRQPRQ